MTEKSETRLRLEARATELGVTFAGNIGDEKLAERVAEAEQSAAAGTAAQGETAGTAPPAADPDAGSGATIPQVPPASGPTELLLEVKGPREGFRRAGRRFGPEATLIPMAALTDSELLAIRGEPRLMTTTIERPTEHE